MELRRLRYFVAVAEEGQVTRAAQRLGMKQPPLTQQIQLLERELGVQLFARSPRRIELNAAGRLFLGEARSILASAEDAVSRLRQFDKGIDGVLNVGLTSSSLLNAATQVLFDRFRRDFPQVSLKIEEAAAFDLLRDVREGRLDVAFIRAGEEHDDELGSRRLAEEALVAALPADAAPTASGDIALADLQRHKVVLYRQDQCVGIGDMLLSRVAGAGARIRIADETRRLMSALHMAGVGIGMTVVPESMRAFRLPGVVYRPLGAEIAITVPLNLVYRRRSPSTLVRHFLHAASEVTQSPDLQGIEGTPGA